MSKSKIFAAASSVITYLFVTASVYAAVGDELKAPGGSLAANTKIETIPQFIVDTMFTIAAVLAVIYLMYGGIKWITSRGDKIAVESARKHIIAAVIGLVVVAGSFFALKVVFTLLGANNPLEQGFKFKTINETNNATP